MHHVEKVARNNELRADLSPERSSLAQTQHLYPVILCGGAGKRLWPLSRKAYPKQLLPLASERTMLQETAERARILIGLRSPVVLCSEDHRFLVNEQLSAIDMIPEAILCEPVSRNTGPALAAAAAYLRERDPEAIMLVLPADHYIGNGPAFAEAAIRALRPAANGWLVTFGIKPTHAETGYGYIERGSALDGGAEGVYAVERFVEKPDAATASLLVADGSHFWNSGMFVLPVEAFLEQLDLYSPAVAKAAGDAVTRCRVEDTYVHLDETAFAAAPDLSVDYAVMEHTDRAVIIPADMAWSDIGSWRALRDVKEADHDGNVLQGNVFVEDVQNSYIRADDRLVAVLGLDDVVVVDTDDALLVTHASRAADVGQLVQRLSEMRHPESIQHRRAHRPWGHYESIDLGQRFQVKHIVVKPGAQLSLQMHHHRAEHWVVVSGTARVTCGTQTRLLYENQWVFIPIGALHRLENPGNIPLHLIEVQIGTYLGEDDIVRFEDNYGRA
ncbi:MAG: mannose-1-phosphate guanylyltransferase/mannose-6-phosphate isomerase [Rhodospirillales bacterium]|nr:mannose-1-phosphate guanylyltransferase/mannose-6-phosphate isomerase [Rhodospirillales bacterium]